MEIKNSGVVNPRRQFLKGTLAGGAVASGLPEKWTSPVVESVLLPAHAATSCALELSIPGGALTCADMDPVSRLYFAIDDTGPCPILVSQSSIADPGVNITRLPVTSSGSNRIGIVFSLRGLATTNRGPNTRCGDSTRPIPEIGTFSDPVSSISGALWVANYTISGVPGTSVTYSSIQLVPI